MRILLSLLLATAAAVRVAVAAADERTGIYRADIIEIPGTSSGVTGAVYVFVPGDQGVIGYTGYATNAQPNLLAATCNNATNACGAHVHNGTSCADTASQGGHLYVPIEDPDPWTEERYSSNEDGDATFSGVLDIGTDDVNGRAFICK
jgi:hypothetical protein